MRKKGEAAWQNIRKQQLQKKLDMDMFVDRAAGDMYIHELKKYIDCKFSYAVSRQRRQEQEEIRRKIKKDRRPEYIRIFGTGEVFADRKELEKAKMSFLNYCRQLAKQGAQPYLEYLVERFALSAFERHCVRMLFVYEMDTDYAHLAALLQDGWGYVTPYLAWLSFEDGNLNEEEYSMEEQFSYAFAEDGKLVRFFLEPELDEDSIFCMRRLRLSKRVIDFACGNLASGSFRQMFQYFDEKEMLKPWIGQPERQVSGWLERQLHGRAAQQSHGRTEQLYGQAEYAQICYLYGETGSGRRFSIRHACREMGYSCCQVSLDACMREMELLEPEKKRSWLDGLLREILFFQEIPIFVSEQKETEAVLDLFSQMEYFLQQTADLCPAVFLCMRIKVYLKELHSVTYLHQRPLTLLEGREYWEAESRNYPISPGLELGSMSNKFRLTPGMIRTILKNAENIRIRNGEKGLSLECITEECYGLIAQQMGKRAVKVPAVYSMEDLILPERQKQQLLDACGQVRYKHKVYEEWGFQEKTAYGTGVSMVFAGPPGTGKTMAAQVIARELGMELYKVDLSCVVSKYVGETEKNLNEIFDQAEKSQVILLFDEADALFGKRSEGKESADKYSNMEAAFLLQKMEGYEGITILATNLFHHFDEAFKRRIKMIVEFPLPGEDDRRQLWKSMIPHQMPTGDLDFDYLARQFELTGSNIRNILLHSAFLAASKQKAVSMEEIIPAVKNEYAKNGKSLTKGDVSEYYMYLE